MKSLQTLRPILNGMTMSAGLTTALFGVLAEEAEAQQSVPAGASQNGLIALDPIDVAGEAVSNTLQATTGLERLPGTLQSTPQTITVIPQVVIQQQQATTVNQVLQYVPGITVATGEGNGGMNGDQFRIRGFDAKGDVYVDGLRDFGAYVRDSFSTESVTVLKGPSSESFGAGTTGGAIELQSKKAHLGNAYSVEGVTGNGPFGRVVADINQQINETTAVRMIAMGHDQDLVDRDHDYSKRWGFLGSIGLGLGTDQTFTLNYLHQHGDRRPDMGVPMVVNPTPGAAGYPVTEYGVPRSNYFGKETDRDVTEVDMVTARYRKDFGDILTITNDTRYAQYTRYLAITPTMCSAGISFFANFGTCSTDVLAGKLNTGYTVWPVVGLTQNSSGAQNITTARARFETGPFRHELIAGIDVYYQENKRNNLLGSTSRSGGTLLDPDFSNPAGFNIYQLPSGMTEARSRDVGLFASDRMWLTSQLSILGGLRWDDYHSELASWDSALGGMGQPLTGDTRFLSPKAALIFEPSKLQTYYVSYAKSFTPQGGDVSLSFGQISATQPNLKPEDNKTIEVGAKWGLLDGKLGLTAALFRVEKSSTTFSDPTTGLVAPTGETHRVQGLELGLTGQITPAWTIQAGYTYMDSKVLSWTYSSFEPFSTVGHKVPYVSENSASLWTTYDIATLVPRMQGKLLVGTGVNYRSEYSADSGNVFRIPAATTVDALLSYEIDKYRLALNVYNLTNQLTYTSAFYYRAEVAPGRAFTVTASAKF